MFWLVPAKILLLLSRLLGFKLLLPKIRFIVGTKAVARWTPKEDKAVSQIVVVNMQNQGDQGYRSQVSGSHTSMGHGSHTSTGMVFPYWFPCWLAHQNHRNSASMGTIETRPASMGTSVGKPYQY